jgi:predicted transcriptional regulator
LIEVKIDMMSEYRAPGMLEDLLLREKPARIMISLKTSKESIYATILSRETKCTYSHTIKILNVLRSQGLVDFEKTGRIKHVKLTSDGWDIAHNLEALTKKFDQIAEKAKTLNIEKKPAPKAKSPKAKK